MSTTQQRVDASTLSAMKIYDWFDGPYPARVRIALAEKGLLPNVEFVSVNLWTGEQRNLSFLLSTTPAHSLCLSCKMER